MLEGFGALRAHRVIAAAMTVFRVCRSREARKEGRRLLSLQTTGTFWLKDRHFLVAQAP